jgi:hypothetical protein
LSKNTLGPLVNVPRKCLDLLEERYSKINIWLKIVTEPATGISFFLFFPFFDSTIVKLKQEIETKIVNLNWLKGELKVIGVVSIYHRFRF